MVIVLAALFKAFEDAGTLEKGWLKEKAWKE